MNPPAPTPLPIATFQNHGDESPAYLLEYLQKLLSQVQSDPLLGKGDSSAWIQLISGLTENFLADFPTPLDIPWDAMHEKLRLTEVSLELICRAIGRVDNLFAGSIDVAYKAFARMLGLAYSLEIWMDTTIESVPGYPNPRELQDNAIGACATVLWSLDARLKPESNGTEDQKSPFKMMLQRCLDGCNAVMSSSHADYSLFFGPMRLEREEKHDKLYDPYPEDHITVVFMNTTDVSPSLAVLILRTCLRTVALCLSSLCYLGRVIRNITRLSRRAFEWLTSTSCFTNQRRRTRCLVLLCSTFVAEANALDLGGQADNFRLRLLHYRLGLGPNAAWELWDQALQDILAVPWTSSPVESDVQVAIDLSFAEQWEAHGDTLRDLTTAFFRASTQIMDARMLRVVRAALSSAQSKIFDETLHIIDARSSSVREDAGAERNEVINDEYSAWIATLRTTVQGIIEPNELMWTDKPLSCEDHIIGAFSEIEKRFGQNGLLYDPRPEARKHLAELFTDFSSVLARSDSYLQSGDLALTTALSSFMPVAALLLDGEEATHHVRKSVYATMAQILHRHPRHIDGSLSHVADVISRGMRDRDRGVRLSAGDALRELARFYQNKSESSQDGMDRIFALLRRLFDTTNARVKETALIAIGRVGRIAESELLGRTLSCLISQLGGDSPMLNGVARLQLQGLAKFHKKSHYSLLSPYLDFIAPYLVSRMASQKDLFLECCRFISMTPKDFLVVNLGRTLPHAFATGDIRILEAISAETEERVHALLLKHSAEVLAHAFRLQGPGQTNKVLHFILGLLKEAGGNRIDMSSVVRSCLAPLLTDLVTSFGDDDPTQADAAMQGLKKVERCVASPNGSRGTPAPDPAAFLRAHMLAIMSHLSELLQDVQGRRSLQSKRQILRSFGPFIQLLGPAASSIAPQVMATLQTALNSPELAEVTLQTWYTFLSSLDTQDLGPFVGPTSASIVAYWSNLPGQCHGIAKDCLRLIVEDRADSLGEFVDTVADLHRVPELASIQHHLETLRRGWSVRDRLQKILDRTKSESLPVALQSMYELKRFMSDEQENFVRALASGDAFDPLVGHIVSALLAAACRDGEDLEPLRLAAFDCIGALGAVDPDRFELSHNETRIVMLHNFTDETENASFALHLIRDLLVNAFRSTSDIKYQRHLAYSIQELLDFCKFTPSLVTPGSTNSIPIKVRNRWNSLPKHVLETVTPLLESRLMLENSRPPDNLQLPVYPTKPTYREWIQTWVGYLLTRTDGNRAQDIFQLFPPVVRNKDVTVAYHLLPHLVLHVLLSGEEDDVQHIREELLAILQDQVDTLSMSSADKKLLSAQTVFMLMDHLNQWVRLIRRDILSKKAESKRSRANQVASEAEEHLLRIDSVLSSIDQGLTARAALECKAYARSLMNFEQQIVSLKGSNLSTQELHEYYEKLHEIYAHLDEPDGMEGVSTLILSPSLEHQIRQHESTGRWTSAQSCWEVRLQQSPDNLEFHIGLLRCLRNLGHYDTLRTHVKGVLVRNPVWESRLLGFQVESEWMIGNWGEVQALVKHSEDRSPPILLAQVLLAMKSGDSISISNSLANAKRCLGTPIISAGANGYRRSYDAVLDLHLTHELEMIYNSLMANLQHQNETTLRPLINHLTGRLSTRLDSTLPNFRVREAILSMRRTVFGLGTLNTNTSREVIGQAWLASAKLARKAGHRQTAYSAMLQVQQSRLPLSFIESAKLVKAGGEPLRALQELENSMRLSGIMGGDEVIDLTDDKSSLRMKAKAQLARARWMNDSERFEMTHVLKAFQNAAELWAKWESGLFYLGQFHDECYKTLSKNDQANRGIRMNLQTVRNYAKAIRYGSKYIYQTVPRLLTLWLDMGEDRNLAKHEIFSRVNTEVSKAIKSVPVYKWYTAFPQIVSRVGHGNDEVYQVLSRLISTVIQEYPRQALWLFTSVVKSTKAQRAERGRVILDKLRAIPGSDLGNLVKESLKMTEELLNLCDHPVRDDKKTLNMAKDFPGLFSMANSRLIIPLQESLTAALPPPSSSDTPPADGILSTHQPFPINVPTFERFQEEIDIMRSLAKPRKITVRGSDGQVYMFLGKPKDDLRKDARLMDFNVIINKLLKSNSESRRRQLHIRTYGVVTLNEECGFIQWVPNTVPLRPVLLKSYERRNIRAWSAEMNVIFAKIKEAPDKEAAQLFNKDILSIFPPVFHEWFVETFPEPTAWLASRLAYSRTAAVMSMVGFILGLGDRHCENILLDTNTGDVVHVDFNCLFEKGKTLETPERVPFRLTQNMVDGLGVTGVEGIFRIACEVTMQLLRDNKDSLMSILDAFVHDPLVEWEDEKRKLEREAQRKNTVRSSVDLRMLAKNALKPIEKKLKGVYTTSRERTEKEISTSNLVQMLIQEASDDVNLAKMYPGWAPWH